MVYCKQVCYHIVMDTLMISLHVIAMCTSIVLMLGAVVGALVGKRHSLVVARGSMLIAGIGLATGIVMLFSAPILSKCLVLSAYLVAMVAVYGYGFGWGYESKAKLLNT